MPNGFWGRILRVNLTNHKVTVEEQDEKFYRKYLGGRGIIAHYLLKEVPQGCNPLGPENILIFAASVLTGLGIPGAGRNSVGAKSPLTGGYGEGEGGGEWGVKLRWAGYDALVVSGKSEKPVYLWINNDAVEFRDASHLWGMEAFETQSVIRQEVGDPRASTAVIGPGAERLISFACIALDMHNYIGRCGIGAVMGSKNLKAVAVNGKTQPNTANPDVIKDFARWMFENYEAPLGTMKEMGTARGVPVVNAAGAFPTRNFREGSFEGFEKISGRTMTDTILVGRESCYACPVHCKRVVEITDDNLTVSHNYGGPEYESIAGFGSDCGIDDLKSIAKANEICDRFTIDTISASMMISGAMECAELELLPAKLVDGLDLRFGSSKGMLTLLEQIVNREDLGDILARGPRYIAKVLGEQAASYFLHVKGQPVPFQEPRWKVGTGLGYAISPTGADHMHNIADNVFSSDKAASFDPARNMGILDGVDTSELSPAKARLFSYMILNKSIYSIITMCAFMPYSLDMIVDEIKASTGWNTSNWEVIKAAERALAMARAFNTREGFTAEDDSLPNRFFSPLLGGPLKGQAIDREKFFQTRKLVYDMLGWDHQNGGVKRWKLYELGLDFVADDLEKIGLLSE